MVDKWRGPPENSIISPKLGDVGIIIEYFQSTINVYSRLSYNYGSH